MGKKKKFERKTPRPTLAASLEAVRQGKALEAPAPQATEEVVHLSQTSVPAAVSDPDEVRYLRAEVARIARIMSILLGLLIVLSTAEARTGILTRAIERFF